MAYKAPIWEDGKSPAISAENLNNLSQAAEGAQVLYGNSAPTSSTEGAVGQFYLVVVADGDGNYPLYQCVAIANGSYVWRDTRRIPDSITSMLGIPAPGTINSALNVLANIGNVNVWSRTITLTESTYKPVVGVGNYSVTLDPGDKLYYSDSVDIASLQDINLASPVSTFSFTGGNFPSVVGKYLRKNNEATIYIYPQSDQSISGNTLFLRGCHVISAAVDIPAGTTTDYLTSTDRNAYPDQSAEGGEPEIPAHYTLADAATVNVLSSGADYSASVYSCDLNSIIVNNDGSISTTGFSVLMSGNGALTLPGNWTEFSTTKAYYITSNSSNVVFTDTIFTVSAETTLQYADGKYVLPGCRELIGHAKVEAIPPNTSITYLGQLGGGARIEVGSYVGTGTESADILLRFTPKAVIVSNYSYLGVESNYSAFILPGLPNEAKVKRAEIIDGGFRVYYYSSGTDSYASYLNNSGNTYRYIAIG